MPSVTTAPAPIRESSPTTAPFNTIAPIPTSTRSRIVQPWRIAPCPTDTSHPSVVREPDAGMDNPENPEAAWGFSLNTKPCVKADGIELAVPRNVEKGSLTFLTASVGLAADPVRL